MKRIILTTVLAASAVIVSSCAVGGRQSADATTTPRRSCFLPSEVQNWKEESALSVLIKAQRGAVYRAKLLAPCIDLSSASAIVIEPRGGEFICEKDEAHIHIPSMRSSGRACEMYDVHYLTAEELAAVPENKRP